ncbi:uncharacterized protein LOC113367779 [Ctenocephalides felis]|uniref:uncharacterized protein LOC113367779 n=1 Tax=Ctenocephalides felis TaxID=7515 RepID=UPI000E6E2A81|nr:uncharacterized protein LOC113367779 [Ctenocephalides felis]
MSRNLSRLQLAASDEQSASDWLQALIQASSGVFDFPESKPAKASTLLLTSKHIVLVRESFDNLLPLKTTLQNPSSSKYLLKSDKQIKNSPSASNLTVREKYLEFLRQQQQCNQTVDTNRSTSDEVIDVVVDEDKLETVPEDIKSQMDIETSLKTNRSTMFLDLVSNIDKPTNFISVKESSILKDDAMSLASDASDSVTTSASDISSAKMRHFTTSTDQKSVEKVLDKIRRKMSASEGTQQRRDKNLLANINNSRKSEFGKGVKVLSCASLAEVCSVKIPSGKGVENCCVVEFACHEVSESGGDMVLFFTNGNDLDKFIATLEVLWSHNNTDDSPFPISTLDLNNQVNAYYGDTFQMVYKKNWMPTHSGLSQALRNK